MAGLAQGIDQTAVNTQSVADRLNGIDETNPLEMADYTGPLTGMGHGGVTLANGETHVIDPNGRVLLELTSEGPDPDGLVRLGFNMPAEADKGIGLRPWDAHEQFEDDPLHLLYVGPGTVHVTWQMWGATE